MARYGESDRGGRDDRSDGSRYDGGGDYQRSRGRDDDDDRRSDMGRMMGGQRSRRDLSEGGYGGQHTRGAEEDYEGWNAGDMWDDDMSNARGRGMSGQGGGQGAQGWNEGRSGSNSGYRGQSFGGSRNGGDRNDGQRSRGAQQDSGQRYGGGQSGARNFGSDGDASGGGANQSYGGMGRSGYVGGFGEQSGYMSGQDDEFEPDYTRWREEQMRTLDEDYRAFRTERAKKFGSDFDEFRQGRERTSQKSGGASRKGGQNAETQT